MEIRKLLTELDRPWRFLPHTMAEYLSRGKWKPYEYLTMISHRITEEIAKGNGRLMISLPPRHGKSELISHWIPVWFLENWPDQNILLTSYEADFAASWGRKVRDTIQSNQDNLTVALSNDSLSASRWNTKQGGGMVTAGAGGPITGRGGDLIVVDDPHKNWVEAQSETIRKRLIDWFYSTLYTRAEPGSTIAIIATRWHQGDLIGELLANHAEDWEEIRLPALAEENDLIGRQSGQALCPERFDEKSLHKIKETIGSSMFEALYQQNPAPPEGHLFKKDWWKFFNQNSFIPFIGIVQSWDCAYETGIDNSFSVCQSWGVAKNGFYLLHQLRDKLEYPELVKAVKSQAQRFNPSRILIEYQASGRALVQDLRRRTRLPIHSVKVTRDSKESRARLATAVVESGKVFLPKGACWLDEFLQELTMFPTSKYSDQVDALSQALDLLKNITVGDGKRPSVGQRPSSGRPPLYGYHKLRYRGTNSGLNFGPWVDLSVTRLTKGESNPGD
jgi:predicted phage terminase large subunit-like protein